MERPVEHVFNKALDDVPSCLDICQFTDLSIDDPPRVKFVESQGAYSVEGQESDMEMVNKRTEHKPHQPWELAQEAVKSFDGSQPARKIQQDAVQRWQKWKELHWTPGHLEERHFPEMAQIFGDIFFLGRLGSDSVKIEWGIDEEGDDGFCVSGCPSLITLNSSAEINGSSANALGVVLHEMVHAFLERNTEDEAYEEHPDLGAKGHRRAWQFLAKAIDQNMTKFLGLAGSIGRDIELFDEIEAIVEYHADVETSLLGSEAQLAPLLDNISEMPYFEDFARFLKRHLAELAATERGWTRFVVPRSRRRAAAVFRRRYQELNDRAWEKLVVYDDKIEELEAGNGGGCCVSGSHIPFSRKVYMCVCEDGRAYDRKSFEIWLEGAV